MTEHEKQIQDEISKRLQFAFRKIDNIIREYMIKKNLTEYEKKRLAHFAEGIRNKTLRVSYDTPLYYD